MASLLYELSIAESGRRVATKLELADSMWKRGKGLLGRSSLEEGGGMRFEPASSLHMWFMRFAIDVIYVDRQERVVKLVRHFKPWRVSWARGARTAYELPAGTIDRCGIEVGDRLEMRLSDQVTAA